MMVLELHQSAIPTPGQALRTGHGHDEIPIWRFNSSEISRPSAVFVLLVTSSHIAETAQHPVSARHPGLALLGGWTRFSNCLVLQTANRVVNRDPVDPLCRLPRHINMHLIPIDHRHRTRRDIRYQTLSIASDISSQGRSLGARQDISGHWGVPLPAAADQDLYEAWLLCGVLGRESSVISLVLFLSGELRPWRRQGSFCLVRRRDPLCVGACHGTTRVWSLGIPELVTDMKEPHFALFLAPQRRTMGFTESPSGLSHFPRDSCQISWLGTG